MIDISEFYFGSLVFGFVLTIASTIALTMLFRDNKKAGEIERDYESLGRLRSLVETEKKKLEHAVNRSQEYARAKKFLEERPMLEAEKEELVKNIATAETRLSELGGDIKKAEDGLDRLSKDARELEEKNRKNTDTLQELEREASIVAGERNRLTKERDEAEAELEQLQQKSKSLEDENEKLVKSNCALKDSVRELSAKKEAAEKWLEANKDKLALRKDLDQEIERKQKRVESLDTDLADSMKSIAGGIERLNKMNLSGVQTLRQNAFASLKDPVFKKNTAQPVADPGDRGEQKALKVVAGHFKKVGFIVPQRLLWAFHTSLKTSDISSLTVMAGLSGTGKSALPKLYSEAMGICFQPLAVEPRWDSPKDLLGFFNYVTNRYEPTLLARALFQFQGGWIGNDGFRPDMDLSVYMFMPMLDEMNLARIEYYFSEFLSKLEMRRLELDDLTEENCRAVALEVFQGFEGVEKENGKRITEKAIRIFANTNTLFVGTMNEDETTQSLSDKVIDRANVLYFGRPNKLQPKIPDIHHAPNVGLLPLKTWNSWKKEVKEGELPEAPQILKDLNKELAAFNRPFAHRTYQAMLSYIANYPAVPGAEPVETKRLALADQIGMRIMPKLRGLDLSQHQETFTRVGGIIRKLGDHLLANSFERATDQQQNRTGFFEWSGFDWDDKDNAS